MKPEQLKTLLAAGIPLIIGTSFEARTIEEEWIRPEPNFDIGHQWNIIGYGLGQDPSDLQWKDYFLVRDSHVLHSMHHKVAVDELVPILHRVAKVMGVVKLDTPKIYPQEVPKPASPE